MRITPDHRHLPPQLREVCGLLAVGLVRLQRYTAEDVGRNANDAREREDNSLRFVGHQSSHADPRDKEFT